MKVIADITADNIVEGLNFDHDAAFELITQIDSEMQDYEFTERLAKHFIQELINELSAAGETLDISILMPTKEI